MQNLGESITPRQLGGRLMHNLLQEIENPHRPSSSPHPSSIVIIVIRTRRRIVERESTHGQFHHGESHAPHVGSDGVRSPLDPLGSHVGRRADEGVGDGVDGFGGNAEIAQFDVAPRVEENVGRFDVSVHDPVGFVEIDQAGQDGFGDFAQHVDSDGPKIFGYTVQ